MKKCIMHINILIIYVLHTNNVFTLYHSLVNFNISILSMALNQLIFIYKLSAIILPQLNGVTNS